MVHPITFVGQRTDSYAPSGAYSFVILILSWDYKRFVPILDTQKRLYFKALFLSNESNWENYKIVSGINPLAIL